MSATLMGRPRLEDVERYASGRIRKKATPKAKQAPPKLESDNLTKQRQLELAKANTALGRLELSGVMTLAMAEAGRKYEERRDAYLRAIDAPRRSVASPRYERETEAGKKVYTLAITLDPVETPDEVRRAIKSRKDADDDREILDAIGKGARSLVSRVVIDDYAVSPAELPLLLAALHGLAEAYARKPKFKS